MNTTQNQYEIGNHILDYNGYHGTITGMAWEGDCWMYTINGMYDVQEDSIRSKIQD